MLRDKLRCEEYHKGQFGVLKKADEEVYKLITNEYERVQSTLQLVAAENQCSRAALAALGSVVQNKTAEGFPGRRRHSGCEVVDELERLAIARAKETLRRTIRKCSAAFRHRRKPYRHYSIFGKGRHHIKSAPWDREDISHTAMKNLSQQNSSI